MKKFLLGMLYLFPTLMWAATHPSHQAVMLTDLDRPIVRQSQQAEFTLRLSSQPSTGYQWFLRSPPNALIQVLGHHYERAKGPQIGGVMYDEWRFRLAPQAFTVPRVLQLEWAYQRPWEQEASKYKAVTIFTLDATTAKQIKH